MADAPVLPFSFADAAQTYAQYVHEISEHAATELGRGILNLDDVGTAVERLEAAGAAFDVAYQRTINQGSRWLQQYGQQLRDINREIFMSERDLSLPDGLPRREWFRHSIYAPGFYTGYGVKTMPGIREAVEQGDANEAVSQAADVAVAIDRMAQRVEAVVRSLNLLTN
jgi:N-acetylated-alpha-linked acidic dipeptidase